MLQFFQTEGPCEESQLMRANGRNFLTAYWVSHYKLQWPHFR